MSTKKRTVQELKEEIAPLRAITPWENIKANEVYHIPPIITLERREIIILSKEKDKAVYHRIGDTDKKNREMHRTSVFAKFIVKRKKY